MDVYRQAAEIIGIVRKGNGTAKALCLRKEMQKKKQTYAVVCETLRHYELLEDVLAVAEFFKYYPQANHEFAICMAYDAVIGKGLNTHNDSTARAITQSASYLREAYWQVHKHHVIPLRNNEKWDDPGQVAATSNTGGGAHPASDALQLPRYARVNTLKISVDELVSRLRRSAESRKRVRETEKEGKRSTTVPQDDEKRIPHRASSRLCGPLPDFTLDPIVPHLLVFPPGTDLHAHPAVRSGQLILQDRASCLPAAVLLDAVPVEVGASIEKTSTKKNFRGGGAKASAGAEKVDLANGSSPRKPLEYVVDACAAPGNKTTQLAAIGAPSVKIMATERDERRSGLLQKRVASLGAADYVNVVNMDFFQLSSDDRAATEAILLDPSCSASGVMTRVDVALQHHHREHKQPKVDDDEQQSAEEAGEGTVDISAIDPATQGNNFSMQGDRVEKLARLQRKLLAHSLLSFDNCRTVVYSTCSVHEEENEDVVRQVLEDERVQARGWQLSNIMPDIWKTRGLEKDDDKHPLRFTIRCDPAVDATNGFFVARFDRKC